MLDWTDPRQRVRSLYRAGCLRTAGRPKRWGALLMALALATMAGLNAAARAEERKPKLVEPNRGGQVSLESVDPQVALKRLKVAEGYEVNLFASEKDFPLDNPVSLTFDAQGRMWVATMPTYPHYLPGTPPDDKLIILEDTDGDGRADRHKVFVDGLYLPTGFELGDGGAYIAQQPNLLFVKDTDGDDVADVREVILHGFGTEDSHHAISAFTWGPGGALYFQEGTFHHSQVETPYGPVRLEYAGVFRYKPRRFRLEVFVSYPFANPWGHVFDRWGQNFIADASGGANYFGTAITGHVDYPNKHASMKVFTSRVRPTAGCEIVASRHFPPEAQGVFLINNCIGFQGIKQHRIIEEGSGFTSKELEPLLESMDINFRPVDLQFGPDGALYVVDWFNPLIGHMQYSLRDERRDHRHGRIWRITYKKRPLLKAPKIAGQPIAALLDLLKSYEDRTRYRVRRELREHDPARVAAELKRWIAGLDASDPQYQHHLLEALWVYQTINVVEPELLRQMLRSPEPRARAAATRVLRYWRDEVSDALQLVKTQIHDEHPRVRLEAVLACSFFANAEAAEVALEVLEHPTDYYLDYVLKETINTLEPYWKPAVLAGRPFAANNEAGIAYLLDRLPTDALTHLPPSERVDLALLTRPDTPTSARRAALSRLAERRGRDETAELLAVLDSLDRQSDEAAAAAVAGLGRLLVDRAATDLQRHRKQLQRLATQGAHDAGRRAAYAALIKADGGVERLWPEVTQSIGALLDLLAAIPLVPDDSLRNSLYDRVAPLLDDLPKPLAIQSHNRPQGLGRYVRIELPGAQRTLTLAEVEVYSNGKNIAPRGKAKQHSTAFGGWAQRAIDGNKSGRFGDGGQTHTRGNVADPWWELDLGREVPIEAVVVWNRNEGGGDRLGKRLDGFTLSVLNGKRQPVFQQTDIPAPDRYVRIEVDGDPRALVRRAAIEAITHVAAGHEREVFEKLAHFVVNDVDRDAAIAALEQIDPQYWNTDALPGLARALVSYFATIPPKQRTTPEVLAAFELGRQVAARLPADLGREIGQQLDELAVQIVRLRAVPHQMRYDRKELAVEAGRPVEIVFENPDVMPHNVIVAAPGSLKEVGQAAERMTAQGNAYQRQFIPELPSVLHATRLVGTGEVARLQFVAPTEPDDYPYLCTFPGHYRTMNGILHVVPDVDAYLAEHPLPEETIEIKSRPLVREWTFDELLDSLDELRHGRSFEQGKAMFKVAACVACHKLGGEGREVGPDLRLIRKQLEAKERTLSDVLRDVLEPSHKIGEKYRSQIIVTADGEQLTGLIVGQDDEKIELVTNPLADPKPRVIARDDIDEQVEAKISLMPKGLLNTLHREEILDLLAYIISAADPQHPAFRP